MGEWPYTPMVQQDVSLSDVFFILIRVPLWVHSVDFTIYMLSVVSPADGFSSSLLSAHLGPSRWTVNSYLGTLTLLCPWPSSHNDVLSRRLVACLLACLFVCLPCCCIHLLQFPFHLQPRRFFSRRTHKPVATRRPPATSPILCLVSLLGWSVRTQHNTSDLYLPACLIIIIVINTPLPSPKKAPATTPPPAATTSTPRLVSPRLTSIPFFPTRSLALSLPRTLAALDLNLSVHGQRQMNVLAQIGTPPPSPPRSRAPSASNIFTLQSRPTFSQPSNDDGAALIAQTDTAAARRMDSRTYPQVDATPADYDEKTPLLRTAQAPFAEALPSKSRMFPQRISGFLVGSITFVLSPVIAVGQYVIACFRDEQGNYSLFAPVYHMARPFSRARRKKERNNTQSMPASSNTSELSEKGKSRRRSSTAQSRGDFKGRSRRSPSITSIASTSTAVSSDSELESERPPTRDSDRDAPSRHTRSKSSASSTTEEIAPARRQIRIKLHNEESLRQRKSAKKTRGSKAGSTQVSAEAAAALKSPTGSMSSKQMTKFPRAPQPPRPLVPRRQPSYSASGASAVGPHQKTLILDLDETLIHSMAKGGRFTTGHMVEVKLQHPVGAGGQIIGPQVPILYYVHKRPYCDEFLKKVCKWYNLIIFTASVQEYADPVIDWLEAERKYFAGRYYRQHCTFRNGAYIKDLAQVEPDLSKVMIIDNSPMCYIFHEDNAIPIEGWISDPTDNGLLHLIPLLEGLQYVTDVRALLALRMGQPPSS
ncbi:unnamed protein product [Periconia digitata]|uniref:FCP1 homology domain-containing protein n=1 Tax=Periconia digitata TaxID=1303443 RepID=A0A9W4UK24_9PLEO|nr:unnamed protein product [Periconia digitata]